MNRGRLLAVLMVLLLGYGYGSGFVSANIQVLLPADEGLRSVYGSSHLVPRLKAGLVLCERYVIWGSASWMSDSGQSRVLNLEIQSSQAVVTLGGGMEWKLGPHHLQLLLGGSFIHFSEEAFAELLQENGFGITLGGVFALRLGEDLFANVDMSHLFGTVAPLGEKILLWGSSLGLGLEYRF